MNIDPSVFPSTRVSARYKKVEHIFSLAWHRVSFDFPSVRVTAAGFLLLPWWKHEWSCCHTGTQVFDVASMSAGHMSKGSVWINGFSRDWWAVTDVRACVASPSPPFVSFSFAGVNYLIDFGTRLWDSGPVRVWKVLLDVVQVLQCTKMLLLIAAANNLLHESPSAGCTLHLGQTWSLAFKLSMEGMWGSSIPKWLLNQ